MTKATAIQTTGLAGIGFTDPDTKSTEVIGRIEAKQADHTKGGKRHPKAHVPASNEALQKLAAHFKNGIPNGQIAAIGASTTKKK